MCVVSMVGDHYREKWAPYVQPYVPVSPSYPQTTTRITLPAEISREEFDALRREVEDMKTLIIRAKAYDEANGEPDCEMDEKVAILKAMADLFGISLEDVLD